MFKVTNTIAACCMVAGGLLGLWWIPVAFVGGAVADWLADRAESEDS